MDETARFQGSVWCNLNVARSSVGRLFKRDFGRFGLTVIKAYIIRSLYENDGQSAGELAGSVGRAATSFTPSLNSLESKGWIERRRKRHRKMHPLSKTIILTSVLI